MMRGLTEGSLGALVGHTAVGTAVWDRLVVALHINCMGPPRCRPASHVCGGGPGRNAGGEGRPSTVARGWGKCATGKEDGGWKYEYDRQTSMKYCRISGRTVSKMYLI